MGPAPKKNRKAKKRTPSQLIMRQLVERDHAVRASLAEMKVLLRASLEASELHNREIVRLTTDTLTLHGEALRSKRRIEKLERPSDPESYASDEIDTTQIRTAQRSFWRRWF
jgi:hypothetical protein